MNPDQSCDHKGIIAQVGVVIQSFPRRHKGFEPSPDPPHGSHESDRRLGKPNSDRPFGAEYECKSWRY
jgi:hypothetical protein